MIRLFVAINLPDPVKHDLILLGYGFPGARWIEPANMHLNLRFIGEVDEGVYQDIGETLTEVELESFDLSLKGTGFFPPKQYPHTLWAGIEKSEPLTILHSRVEAALARVGFQRDSRKYAPHVTLARLNGSPVQQVAGWLATNSLFKTGAFTVESFCLYSSVRTGHGAEYQIEQEYELGSNGQVDL